MWQRLYNAISRANSALEVLGSMDSRSYSLRDTRIAEMRFLRAHGHFLLKRLYKNIPFAVDENLTPEEYNNLENTKYSNDEGWQLIIDDFKYAFDNLPVMQQEVGRPNRAAAAAYLAKTYLYTAHSPNPATTAGVNEAVMLATSKDFRVWEKNRTLLLKGGERYSNTDFRDPFVFKGDDNKFHMLVSTRQKGKGVLAEYVSDNLLDWTDAGVFMTMMWDRFYECPDLFKMGEWWYLVYSEQHDAVRRVQYFKGRTLAELKACTANDAGIWPDSHEGFLDSRGFYAGKTASNGTDRYIWGWCATKAGNNNLGNSDWAGNLVAHKLIQHADGTLTLGEVPAIASSFTGKKNVEDFTLNGETSRLIPRLGVENRMSFKVTTSNPWDKFGISLSRGSDSEKFYSIIVNPESDKLRKINFEEEGGSGFIGNTDGYVFDTPTDGVYDVTVVTDNSVVTVYINDCAAYTNRVYGTAKNCWSINSYGGNISISDITISSK